jgi:2-(1,2-epoxy-1,2-dihydrophenyl)acetyl-CoA isomerase
VSAEEALVLGLVSAVVPDDAVMTEARAWAETIASRAPLSVQANKIGLRQCARRSLDEAVAYERGEWARLQRTRDHVEALHAFFEKRAPKFTGT